MQKKIKKGSSSSVRPTCAFIARHFYLSKIIELVVLFLSGELRYYRGLHKVKVVTQSEGHWTIEALEDFDDYVDDLKTTVKTGEQRIVPPSLVFKQKTLPPMVKEHAYELEMEKKLKRMVAKEEQVESKKTQTR